MPTQAVGLEITPFGLKPIFENALEVYGNETGLRYGSLGYFNAAAADRGEGGELDDPETHLIPLALQTTTAPGENCGY